MTQCYLAVSCDTETIARATLKSWGVNDQLPLVYFTKEEPTAFKVHRDRFEFLFLYEAPLAWDMTDEAVTKVPGLADLPAVPVEV